MHERRALGFELLSEYITVSNKRINDYLNGVLNIRPLGKPVYSPTGREKVSQVPGAWAKGIDFENNTNV
jgi:adenine-specific DNA-methyltransferase